MSFLLSIESWIFFGTLLILGRYYLHRKWQFLAKRGIPHYPPSIMGFGNKDDVLNPKSLKRDLENKKKFGPIWGYYVGTTPQLVIHDLDIIRQVFVTEFASFPIRQHVLVKINGKEINGSILCTEGEQWKRTRSSITPSFSSGKMKQMIGIIEWCADNTVGVLTRKTKTGDGIFNPKEVFSRLSMDAICSAAFSTKVHSQDDTKEEPEITAHAKKINAGSLFSPFVYLCLFVPYFEKFMETFNISAFPRKSLDFFKNVALHVMDRREHNPHVQNQTNLMKLMLDNEISEKEVRNGAKKGITRTEIIGNSVLMFLAGYETTGNAMEFLAYNLAQHPEIQREVQKEIDLLIETEKLDYDGVNKLKLLDMCLQETLRLYGAFIRNTRYSVNEVTINGLTIPKNITVNIPLFAIHHDPEHWDEPWEFRPERMRDMKAIDPMVFQPFGAGPRNCVGLRFAVMEIKMAFAKILHKFTIQATANTPKPPLELKFAFTIRPLVDFDLRAVPREVESK